MIDFFNNNYTGEKQLHLSCIRLPLSRHVVLLELKCDYLGKTTSFCLVIRRVKKIKGNTSHKPLSEGCLVPPQYTSDSPWNQHVVPLSCGGEIDSPWGKQ